MNFKEWLLQEMPISKFQLMGQWGPDAKRAYGYSKQDVGILQNPRAVEKIHKSWSNTKQNFDFYFLRSNAARKHVEVGEVSPGWVKDKLGIDIEPNPESITVIFTQNTGDEKIPMTAWTIAHRLGHAIRRNSQFQQYLQEELTKDFRELLLQIYGIQRQPQYPPSYFGSNLSDDSKQLRALAHAVGTMRSARQNNLRNFGEFSYELVAQWIITGKIKFNPLPKSLILRNRMAWGRPAPDTRRSRVSEADYIDWNESLQTYASKYEYYLDQVFSGLEGRIFVM